MTVLPCAVSGRAEEAPPPARPAASDPARVVRSAGTSAGLSGELAQKLEESHPVHGGVLVRAVRASAVPKSAP